MPAPMPRPSFSAAAAHAAAAQAEFNEKKWVWVPDEKEGYLAGWVNKEEDDVAEIVMAAGGDVRARVLRHAVVERDVRVEVVHVARNLRVVAGLGEEAGLAVLDLERDAAGGGGDDGLAGVDGLGDLDLEALAGGELEREF